MTELPDGWSPIPEYPNWFRGPEKDAYVRAGEFVIEADTEMVSVPTEVARAVLGDSEEVIELRRIILALHCWCDTVEKDVDGKSNMSGQDIVCDIRRVMHEASDR